MAGVLRKDAVWGLPEGTTDLYKTTGGRYLSLCRADRTMGMETPEAGCQKRGLGTGFVRKGLEIVQVDKMGGGVKGQILLMIEAERWELDVHELRSGETISGDCQNSEPRLERSSNGDVAARTEAVTIMNLKTSGLGSWMMSHSKKHNNFKIMIINNMYFKIFPSYPCNSKPNAKQLMVPNSKSLSSLWLTGRSTSCLLLWGLFSSSCPHL